MPRRPADLTPGPLPNLMGVQEPTHRLAPKYRRTRGLEAIELGEIVGVELDPWARNWLIDGLAVTGSGLHERWAAFEVAIELARQNGKSVGFHVRALAGLYLFRERLVVYSAHKGETAMEAFEQVVDLIHSDGELKAEVLKVSNTNGKEGVWLTSGQRMKFRTRTKGGGRGLSGDCVFFDENQDATDDEHSALLPVMSARPNPQLWYAGSAGGRESTVQGRLVRRCERGEPDLVMHRWAGSDDDDPGDPATWARLNPTVGRRMTLAHIAKEHRSMSHSKFARERLTIGDYPREEDEDWVIPRSRWLACQDLDSQPAGAVAFAVDVKPDQEWAAIAAVGKRGDGRRHGEVVEHERGTRWIVPRLKELTDNHAHLGVVLNPRSPAGSLLGEMYDAGIDVTPVKSTDIVQACSWLYGACLSDPPGLYHRGGTALTSSLAEARIRKTESAWTWQLQGEADMSPLMSLTLAVHGFATLGQPKAPPPPPRSAGTPGKPRSETADLTSMGF